MSAHRPDALDRLLVDMERVGAFTAPLAEARRALMEARFLLLSEGGSTLEQREQAILVLERGIRDAEVALNLREEDA